MCRIFGWIRSKLTITTPEWRNWSHFGVFMVNSEKISHVFFLSLFIYLFMYDENTIPNINLQLKWGLKSKLSFTKRRLIKLFHPIKKYDIQCKREKNNKLHMFKTLCKSYLMNVSITKSARTNMASPIPYFRFKNINSLSTL